MLKVTSMKVGFLFFEDKPNIGSKCVTPVRVGPYFVSQISLILLRSCNSYMRNINLHYSCKKWMVISYKGFVLIISLKTL